MAAALAGEGLVLQGIEQRGTTLRVRFDNSTYRAEAQAIGRAARVLTATAPAGIETFVLEPARQGIPLAGVTLRRADLERLEKHRRRGRRALCPGHDRRRRAARRADPGGRPRPRPCNGAWRPTWKSRCSTATTRPAPMAGSRRPGAYRLAPNVSVNGTLRYRLFGDRSEAAISPSTLPPVPTRGEPLWRRWRGHARTADARLVRPARSGSSMRGSRWAIWSGCMAGLCSTEGPVASRWTSRLGPGAEGQLRGPSGDRGTWGLGFRHYEQSSPGN